MASPTTDAAAIASKSTRQHQAMTRVAAVAARGIHLADAFIGVLHQKPSGS
jgi:hypothetical protein